MPCPWMRYIIVNVRFYVSLTWGFQRRARFQPNLFHRETPKDASSRKKTPKSASPANTAAAPRSPEPSEMTNSHRRPGFGTRWSLGTSVRRLSSQDQRWIPGVGRRTPSSSNALSPERKEPSPTSSTLSQKAEPFPAVQEVWFAGCHSDVGGGAVEDTVRYSLGDISLRWMVKQVVLSQCGILFDTAALRRADIDILTTVLANPTQQTMGQHWRRESGVEASTVSSALLTPSSEGYGSEEDMIRRGRSEGGAEAKIWPREQDVLADIHDKLESKLSGYWFLEILPATFAWQEADGEWKSERGYGLANITL